MYVPLIDMASNTMSMYLPKPKAFVPNGSPLVANVDVLTYEEGPFTLTQKISLLPTLSGYALLKNVGCGIVPP
jgi:hypothetical protein